jgi:dihydroorotate dehydrogenase (NAD+) catalytic subunit
LCQDGPIFDASKVDFDEFVKTHISVPLTKVSKKTRKPLRVVLKGRESRKLALETPVMYASGCIDTTTLRDGYTDFSKVGAIIAKGIELRPRYGNPTPRVCEVTGGMLNAIGLQGVGIKKFIKEVLPIYKKFSKPVIVNISGGSIKEFIELAQILNGYDIAALELNISCPNVKKRGMAFGKSPRMTFEVIKAVRKTVPSMYLIAKLTPNDTDIVSVGQMAELAGADAISLINTILAMSIDVKTRRPKLAKVVGGFSGPPIKPIALRMVHAVCQNVGIPVIGIGGIANANDTVEFIIAGASAVQVGTANFANDNVITEICDGLLKIMKLHGANHVLDLRGSLVVD